MVMAHRVARIAVTVLLTSFVWVATAKDLSPQYAMTSQQSNANPEPSVSLPVYGSNNFVFATPPVLYQYKVLDKDYNPRDSRRIDVSEVNFVSNVQRGGGFLSLIPAGNVSET